MTFPFPPAPPPRAGARRWRSRGRTQWPAQALRSPAAEHEAMEKLATADDIAAAVQATARTTSPA